MSWNTIDRIRWGTPCITDGFVLGGSAATIDGRATETGGKTWDITDGSTIQMALGVAEGVAGMGGFTFMAVAHLDAGFADGTIRTDVAPIGESNDPASRNGVVFRLVDDNNFWAFFNYRNFLGQLGYFFRSYVGGAVSYDSGFLQTGARDTGPSIPLIVELAGTSIVATYDGVEIANITSSTHQSATKHGICTRDYGVDYFSACPAEE